LNHQGNFQEAAKALREKGYGYVAAADDHFYEGNNQ